MTDEKLPLMLDEMETSLALHALKFYMNAKGFEVSQNTKDLESKMEGYLQGTTFVVSQVESPSSLFASRGGTIGGASTSEAKKAASAANGAKGGRPRKPNLFIRLHREFFETPDPKLLKKLSLVAGNTDWQPDPQDGMTHGPYVRMYVPEIPDSLAKILSNSMNVISWDEKPFLKVCDDHKMEPCKEFSEAEKQTATRCEYCEKPYRWLC